MPPDNAEGKDALEPRPQPEPGESFRPRSLISHRLTIPVVIGILTVALIGLFLRTKIQSAQLRDETQKRQSAENRIVEIEQNISRQLSQINQLQNELQEATDKGDTLQTEMETLKADRAVLQTQLENSQKDQAALQERLQAEEVTVAELQKKLEGERSTQKMLFSKIERLMEEKATLMEKVAKLEKGGPAVTMPPLVVSQKLFPRTVLEGTILAVNRRYDFVVFNLGENDGVTAGQRFDVLDHEQKVGEVVARRVMPAMTVADIDSEQTSSSLKKHFAVTFHE